MSAPRRPREASRRTARRTRLAAPSTPLNAAGYGALARQPGSTVSAARLMARATAARNGRATATPVVVVPDASAAAVEARRQHALLRLLDPLLDAAGFGGADARGDMSVETTAFDRLPQSEQLPPHPPLTAMLRAEGDAGAQRQLPRFGGDRGAHRALPSWKVLAREKLRASSPAQHRQHGAERLHTMLRSYASAYSAMLHSAYAAAIITDADLTSHEPKVIYDLLTNVFSLKAVRHHCRVIDEAAEQRGIKASTLHVHYAHCHMLSSLADIASPTLAGADAKAASGAGVHALLSTKSKLQRRDAQRAARNSNTHDAAVAECGAVPSGAALGALRTHAERVVVQFAARIHGVPAPFGASEAEALEAVVAIALVLGLGRGVRLGDLQSLTYAALAPPPTPRGVAAPPAAAPGSHAIVAAPCIDLAHFADGKVARGVRSGFEPGAAIPLSVPLHAALVSIFGWFSPVGPHALAPAEVPLLPDVCLLYRDRAAAPAALGAPLAQHTVLLRAPAAAAAAEAWLAARLAATPPRPLPDTAARTALNVALAGDARLWPIPELPLLHHASWRWLRRWALTAQAAAWAARQRYCGAEVAPGCGAADEAAAAIAARAGTSRTELVSTYAIGPWPVRPRAAEQPSAADDGAADLVEYEHAYDDDEYAYDDDDDGGAAEVEGDDGGGGAAAGRCPSSQWRGKHRVFDDRLGRFVRRARGVG